MDKERVIPSTRALRHVRSLLTDDVAQTVAFSIVASRLDYCNALLCGAPAATFDRLQRAQNNLARVVCQSRGRTDARPLLRSLHWLPMRQWVTYKVALLTHKVRATATPAYLSDLIQTHVPMRDNRNATTKVCCQSSFFQTFFSVTQNGHSLVRSAVYLV